MEQICGVFAQSRRSCPVFSDKHLSHNWHDANWMVERCKELEAPFMAGSSMVTAWRKPYLEHPLEHPITEAVAVGFSGLDICELRVARGCVRVDLLTYVRCWRLADGSHTLEVLQCMVERRAGGETGVSAVTYLSGDPVWKAGKSNAH